MATKKIDPRSAEPILFFAGRKHGEFPARDLSGGDLNATAYRRALAKVHAEMSVLVPPEEADARLGPIEVTRPADIADPEVLAAIADELVEDGFYTRARPRKDAQAEAEEPPTDEPPAGPAETPEV